MKKVQSGSPAEERNMRVNLMAGCLLACLLGVVPANSWAAGKYSPDDAKALTLKAVELIQSKGLDGARPVLNAEGEFKHDELYVNVIDIAGTWRVYPPMPDSVGRNMLNVKDA